MGGAIAVIFAVVVIAAVAGIFFFGQHSVMGKVYNIFNIHVGLAQDEIDKMFDNQITFGVSGGGYAPPIDFNTIPAKNVQQIKEAYGPIVEKYAKERNIPEHILYALIYHESRGVADARSPADSSGLMQITPFHKGTKKNLWHSTCVAQCGFTPAATAEEVKYEEYFDPEKNICCGSYILKLNYDKQPTGGKLWNCVCTKEQEKSIAKENKAVFDKNGEYICIDEQYTGWKYALRLYNGWGCGNWVDQDYVETVMHDSLEFQT